MRTSRKRTNKQSVNKFLGAILGICLLTGCHEKTGPSESSAPEETDSGTYAQFYNTKILTSCDTTLYTKDKNGKMKDSGTAYAGALFDIDDASNGSYVHIADSDMYLKGDAVEPSNRWFRNDTNLVPYGEYAVTADTYTIEDIKGQVLLSKTGSETYPVYVKSSEQDPRIGIRFQNAIYYIKETDIKGYESGDAPSVVTATEVPVLMYHFFYSEDNGETRKDGNYVEVNEFREHLERFKAEGRSALTMREVQYFMQGRAQVKEGSLAITIDDNDPSVYTYAYPLLKEYGMHATDFLITGWEDATLSWPNWEMREEGIELQSHGFLTHQGGCSGMGHGGRLLCMDYNEGVDDARRSFEYVDGGFVYCYPFGDVNEQAERMIQDAGGILAFTTEPGLIHPGMDMLALPRVRIVGGKALSLPAMKQN